MVRVEQDRGVGRSDHLEYELAAFLDDKLGSIGVEVD